MHADHFWKKRNIQTLIHANQNLIRYIRTVAEHNIFHSFVPKYLLFHLISLLAECKGNIGHNQICVRGQMMLYSKILLTFLWFFGRKEASHRWFKRHIKNTEGKLNMCARVTRSHLLLNYTDVLLFFFFCQK